MSRGQISRRGNLGAHDCPVAKAAVIGLDFANFRGTLKSNLVRPEKANGENIMKITMRLFVFMAVLVMTAPSVRSTTVQATPTMVAQGHVPIPCPLLPCTLQSQIR